MGRVLARFLSAILWFLLLSPLASNAQELAYLLENTGPSNVMVSRCGSWPVDHCLGRLLTVDLQERKVIRNETLPQRTFGSLVRSADGRTLLWTSWYSVSLTGDSDITAFDRVTSTRRMLAPGVSAHPWFGATLVAAYAANAFYRLGNDALDVLDVTGVRASIPVSAVLGYAAPRYVAVTADGATAYVATDAGLEIVDVAAEIVAATVSLPGDRGRSVAVSPDGTSVFALRVTGSSLDTETSMLYRVDTASRTIVTSRSVESADRYIIDGRGSLVASADGSSIWLSATDFFSSAFTVQRLRSDTLEGLAQVNIGTPISSLALSPDGSKLVAVSRESLAIIDTATTTVSGSVPLPSGGWRGVVLLPANAPCVFRISPTSVTAPVTGGSFSITVPAQDGCAWSATTPAGWVQLSSQSGTGAATVTLSLSYNAQAAARSTIVTIAGQEVAVVQAAGVVPPGAPGAPVRFNVDLAPGGAGTLSWDPPESGPPPASYLVEAGTLSGDRDFLNINVGLRTSVSGCCLTPQGTRYFRVRAVNAAGAGPASDELAINPFVNPTAPINGRMSWISPSQGVLSWSETVFSAARFRLELRYTSSSATLFTTEVAGHKVFVRRSALLPANYYVGIFSLDARGSSYGWQSVLLEVGSCSSTPPAPTLNVMVVGGLVSISLRADSPQTFDAFRLYAGRSPGASDLGTFDVTTPELTVLVPPGQYFLRAAIVNACGVSHESTEQAIVVQ